MAQAPAIVRDYWAKDSDATVLSTPYDGITSIRGFGESGYRVEVVEHDCPECNFDRMTRRVDVSGCSQDEVRYWCLNPNCPHYLSDRLSHACHGSSPQRNASEPVVSE